MKNAKSVTAHFVNHFKLFAFQSPKIEADCEKIKNILYPSAIGSLINAMVCTRVDISHG